MSEPVSREIHLRRRPEGMPSADDFALVERPRPTPAPGEVLVENLYMSVDPYMRGRMNEGRSYVAGFGLDEPLSGGAIGRVIESNDGPFKVGDHVLSMRGWREHFTSDGRGLRHVAPGPLPPSSYLGVAGMPGLTAYVGLLEIARLAPGETLFVSGAAGAVGSVACQIGRILGCRVIGSAGSARKVEWLEEVAKIDAAFNYRDEAPRQALRRLAPDGIHVYFDNVGGDHLEAALAALVDFGRVALCGAIAQYNATEPVSGPRNLALAISKRLALRGFIVSDHTDAQPAFIAAMSRWIGEGKLRWEETVIDGLESAPEAFLALFTGEKMGKMLVRLAPEGE